MILDVAKSYQTIYDTFNKADEEKLKTLDPNGTAKTTAFRNFVLYLLVAGYDKEKIDLLKVVESMYPRELEKEDLISKFVKKFLTFELMPLDEKKVEEQMLEYEPF